MEDLENISAIPLNDGNQMNEKRESFEKSFLFSGGKENINNDQISKTLNTEIGIQDEKSSKIHQNENADATDGIHIHKGISGITLDLGHKTGEKRNKTEQMSTSEIEGIEQVKTSDFDMGMGEPITNEEKGISTTSTHVKENLEKLFLWCIT